MNNFKKVTVEDLKQNSIVRSFIEAANEYLGSIGYTEHGFRHVMLVSEVAGNILRLLGYPTRICELAEIAGYLHDIGNVINRRDHGQSSAILAMEILDSIGMPADEISMIISAIGNHEEEIGEPINPVSAALILADKSDVNKNRVRNPKMISLDIHDRVNYAVERNFLEVMPDKKLICLKLDIDTKLSSIIEYFETFMPRLIICRRAAGYLGCKFEMVINGQKVL
ncbi:MAG: HD domain-containing protein [Endomicrobia bacterium]|nr:HD domain-containing protein [Endomicrobiia bacterium]MCX7940570.1 HD domain-containing protein [Endomicrobiia bacterium]MDW8056264.1 HD domain-containing protein [Elusimicrobiota bacterium]